MNVGIEKLVLFDIDKTLTSGLGAHEPAFTYAIQKVYGIKTHLSDYPFHGMTDRNILKLILRTNNINEEVIDTKMNDCMNAMIGFFENNNNPDDYTVLPGVKELLKELDEKRVILMGLVTGNLEQIARGKMGALGLNQYFKVGGFGGDEHSERYELVDLAIERARDYNFTPKIHGDSIYLLGDTPHDLGAAIKAKNEVIAIGVATGKFSRGDLQKAGAEIVFDDLSNTKEVMNYLLDN